MSQVSRDAVAWLDEGERLVAWWAKYERRLTAPERKRIADGDRSSIKRELPPAFGRGDWLEVRKRMHVRIESVELKRGKWRCHIDKVEDYRGPQSESVRGRNTFRSFEDVTTLHGAEGREAEPEGVRREHLEEYAKQARAKEANAIGAAIRGED